MYSADVRAPRAPPTPCPILGIHRIIPLRLRPLLHGTCPLHILRPLHTLHTLLPLHILRPLHTLHTLLRHGIGVRSCSTVLVIADPAGRSTGTGPGSLW